jgi:hypothetical protein
MTDRTDDWRQIFGDLTDAGVYNMDDVNIYKLTSHLEELYLKIGELKTQIKDLQTIAIAQDYRNNLGL